MVADTIDARNGLIRAMAVIVAGVACPEIPTIRVTTVPEIAAFIVGMFVVVDEVVIVDKVVVRAAEIEAIVVVVGDGRVRNGVLPSVLKKDAAVGIIGDVTIPDTNVSTGIQVN